MATIKVSNEEVISRAKDRIAVIQCDRNKAELEAIEYIQSEFDNIDYNWVFNRRFLDWFAYFGPFALIGFLFYPISIMYRLYVVKTKPRLSNIYLIAEYLDKMSEIPLFGERRDMLSSSQFEKQLKSCLSLRCMAENNEDNFLEIGIEEAKDLGIC